MKRSVGMKVGVAIQARYAKLRLRDFAVIGLIELLLRKRRKQQT